MYYGLIFFFLANNIPINFVWDKTSIRHILHSCNCAIAVLDTWDKSREWQIQVQALISSWLLLQWQLPLLRDQRGHRVERRFCHSLHCHRRVRLVSQGPPPRVEGPNFPGTCRCIRHLQVQVSSRPSPFCLFQDALYWVMQSEVDFLQLN